MAALGTFTLVVDGEQLDGTAETKARLHLTAQGPGTIRDPDGDEFKFPAKYAKAGGDPISLPYPVTLFTDTGVGEGTSTTIGYEGYVATGYGRVEFQFAAPEAGSTVNLVDVTDATVTSIADLQQFRDETVAARDEAVALWGSIEVDFDTPVRPAQRMQQDVVTVTLTGDLILTLGATPLGGFVSPWVKSGSAAPARLMPTSYTVDGNVVTIPTLLSGDKVLIEYMYDADAIASPAAAASNQFDLYDNFARTTTAPTIGNAVTGQTPVVDNTAAYFCDGNQLVKSTVGANAGAGDGVHWACTSADGWLETAFPTAGFFGLAARVVNSTSRIQINENGIFNRAASVSTRLNTFSETIVVGDAVGLLLVGSSVTAYRRRANAGPWINVGGVTTTLNQTVAAHGIRDSSAINVNKWDYIKFVAGATAPPVVS